MKRVLHYLILAAILLGVPALCAWLGGYDEIWEGLKNFPPRTEDWGFHPEKLWNCRRPFRWGAFVGLAAFTALCLWPFVKRAVRACCGLGVENPQLTTHNSQLTTHNSQLTTRNRFPWWGWTGLAVLAGGWILSWNGHFGWFTPLPVRAQVQISYAPIWAGFILVMNALCVKRSGHSPMTDHPWAYAATFPASSLFWWFFEFLNRYVWNWYYVGIAELSAVEYTVYATVCFASVLPAVCAVAAWLHTFRAFDDSVYSGMARVNLRRPGWCAFLFVLATTGLTGIVFFPDFAYPLIWISPLTVFILVQFLLGERSVLDLFARGNWSVFFRFGLASLICGLCWETWNFYAYAKWVYSVPWVHRFQIWEMPLVGFAGYLPFGVECAAVTAWILPALVENGEGEKGG